VVEAAGIEPATGSNGERAKVGPRTLKVGQDRSQVGQLEGVDVCPLCKGRTGAGQSKSQTGRETSTTGAQRREVAAAAEVALAVMLEVRPGLPEYARRAVVAILRWLQS